MASRNLSNYRNHTIAQESSCNLNWSIPKKSKTDVEKGDKRISVSKYVIISIPTLYPDCIKKLSFHLLSTDANSGATFCNEISKHSARSNTSYAKTLSAFQKQRDQTFVNLSSDFFPYHPKLRKLLFFGRLCDLGTTTLTKQTFLHRLFFYLQSPERKQLGFIHDIIALMLKYNFHQYLTVYLQVGYFPPKLLWKKSVKEAVTNSHIDARRHRMFSDPDFYLFSKINAGRPPSAIWKIPSNVFEIELCKFIVKLWTIPEISPEQPFYQRL